MEADGTILDLLEEVKKQINSLGITRRSSSGKFEKNSMSAEKNINIAMNLIRSLDETNEKMNSYTVNRFTKGKIEFEIEHDF